MNKSSVLFLGVLLMAPLVTHAQDSGYQVQQTVPFATNTAKLGPLGEKALRGDIESLSVLLRYRPESSIEIAGYAAPTEKKPGPLADARAQKVWEFLIAQGLPAERMEPVGHGAQKGGSAHVDIRITNEDAQAMAQASQQIAAPAPVAPPPSAPTAEAAAPEAAAPEPSTPAVSTPEVATAPSVPPAPVATAPAVPTAAEQAAQNKREIAARAAEEKREKAEQAAAAAAAKRAQAEEAKRQKAEAAEAARLARQQAEEDRRQQQIAQADARQAAAEAKRQQQAEAAEAKRQQQAEAREAARQAAEAKKRAAEDAKKLAEETAIQTAMATPPPTLTPEASDAALKSKKGVKIVDNQLGSSYVQPPSVKTAPKSALPGEGSYFIQGTAYFSANARSLTTGSEATIDALAVRVQKLIQQRPNVRIDVVGHADPLTEGAQADVLAEGRAEELVNALVAHGVDRSHLRPTGAADTQPLTSKKGDPARNLNMRAEIRVPIS